MPSAQSIHGDTVRDELILEHMPLVRYLVARIVPQLPPHLDLQDLTGAAVVGLINAADRFDVNRGVLFKTFAEQHIRGAIIDELRSYDVLSRSMRDKYKRLERQVMILEHQLGRNPTGEEVAQSLGVGLDEYYDLLEDVHVISFISLDDSWDDEEGNTLCLADVLKSDAKSPQQQVIMMQLTEALGQAIDTLPEKERLAVTLYYNEDLNLKEIGETLGVSESRISQILSQAMVRLRGKLKLYKA
ncbi:sigma-70 family RNA polymerase sigma factor [Geobacter sp. SVR]|uniref:sigma-70 family RNA polymerase sigma factor n=1 Tax=Geobacter sp. SVR TaxID=2495594 RepID=UPI00143F0050|nr:FliA/WhiG family RNA polymerase sigma factor [Geobacter sp. SVR]BCS55807.1 DNA-directed RNA polymerase sigma-70 factor [Geobacter sp. SVR]GCF83811.1 DNA-directed RNA polymerase sigma-70 factor [Geobacter sp. SVR]